MLEFRNVFLSSPSCENIGVSIKPGETVLILLGAISLATPLTKFSTAPPTGVLVEAVTATNTDISTATQLSDADGDTLVQVEESSDEDKIRFDTGGTERMIIDGSGNVGIATTSPSVPLEVNGDVKLGATNPVQITTNVMHGTSGSDGFYVRTAVSSAANPTFSNIDDTNTGAFFPAADTLGFSTGGSERMRITSSGEVLIGATGSGVAGGLYINTSATNANVGAARIQTSDINGSSDIGCTAMSVVKTANDSTTSNVFVRFGINSYSGGSGQINANGSSQAAFGTFSDRRLKENITDLPSQLDKIKAMRPVEFDYIESEHTTAGEHQLGFIAQEIEEIYPDLVGEDTEGMKTLSGLGKWEARLIKAIQELSAKVEELEGKIE